MEIEMLIHLEAAGADVVWWAESQQLPGVSAAADTLAELRIEWDSLLTDLSEERGETVAVTTERLAGDQEVEAELPLSADSGTSDESPLTRPASATRQVLIPAA